MSELKTEESDVGSHNPKRKYALLIAYCGTGYQGMQINPDCKSIESEIFSALHDSHFVSDENYQNGESLQKTQWMRAARTDKGVHAAGQVVSVKLELPDNGEESSIPIINSHLPKTIQIVGIVRVPKSFNAKNQCDCRKYEYLLPTSVFQPFITSSSTTATQADMIKLLRESIDVFIGTHSYHNYTESKLPGDATACRYIMEFECTDPFKVNDNEFVALRVKGQSFILYQIRKMIGMAVCVACNLTTIDVLKKSILPNYKVEVPTAPSTGLFLDQCLYDHYNKTNKQYPSVAFDYSPIRERVEEFKKIYIYDHIAKQEEELHSFSSWIEELKNTPPKFDLKEIDDETLKKFRQRTQQKNRDTRERGRKRRFDMRTDQQNKKNGCEEEEDGEENNEDLEEIKHIDKKVEIDKNIT